jgi:predicted site-specific integrase-resolvase
MKELKNQMQMVLPEAGFSPREVDRILGLSDKFSYKLIKSGKLEAFVDCVGNLKVHPYEVYRYLREREE